MSEQVLENSLKTKNDIEIEQEITQKTDDNDLVILDEEIKLINTESSKLILENEKISDDSDIQKKNDDEKIEIKNESAHLLVKQFDNDDITHILSCSSKKQKIDIEDVKKLIGTIKEEEKINELILNESKKKQVYHTW